MNGVKLKCFSGLALVIFTHIPMISSQSCVFCIMFKFIFINDS